MPGCLRVFVIILLSFGRASAVSWRTDPLAHHTFNPHEGECKIAGSTQTPIQEANLGNGTANFAWLGLDGVFIDRLGR